MDVCDIYTAKAVTKTKGRALDNTASGLSVRPGIAAGTTTIRYAACAQWNGYACSSCLRFMRL
jgi:hypothetical protein